MTNEEDNIQVAYKSPNSIDQLLSKELMRLSIKARNVIEEEVHGVYTLARTETPGMLEKSLFDLSNELSLIPDSSKAAYLESQILPNTYVNTADFRLRFLRCELFDAKKAAIRMVKFLDLAMDLFGPLVLERPMTLMDLTKDEKKWMQNLQVMPFRDQSGRAILAWVGDHGCAQSTAVSCWKVILYSIYCMSDDIETQQKGQIFMIWVSSNQFTMAVDREHFDYNQKLQEASPQRQVATHWCVPKLPLYHPIHVTRCLMGLSHGEHKSRMKFHFGEPVELSYEMKSYGIPVESIPVTDSGNIKTVFLKQWMQGRKQIEDSEYGSYDADSIILCPTTKDIIFKGGTWLKCHPGNAMFESIIEPELEAHSTASMGRKAAIVRAVICTIQQEDGRFLMWNKQGWWNVIKDDSLIHSKVAEKMRRLSSKLSVREQISRSSTAVFENQDNRKRRKLSFRFKASEDKENSPEDNCNCFVF